VATNAASMAFDFPARVLASPADYSHPVVKWFADDPAGSRAFRAFFAAIVAVGVVALARTTRRIDLPAWAHAAGSMAIFLVWPWNSIMDRFLLSMIPMVVLAYVRGLEKIAGFVGLGPAARGKVVAAGLALVVLGNAGVVIRAATIFHSQGRQWPGASHRVSLDEALRLIRDRTEPDAVVAAFWPEMVHLYTGRTAVPLVEDEAVLVGKLGDISRLRLWRDQVVGRPFYLLVRGEDEGGPSGEADRPQLEALAAEPGIEIREVARTADGRYRLNSVVERTGHLPATEKPGSRGSRSR
jgi:hypothetical protein